MKLFAAFVYLIRLPFYALSTAIVICAPSFGRALYYLSPTRTPLHLDHGTLIEYADAGPISPTYRDSWRTAGASLFPSLGRLPPSRAAC